MRDANETERVWKGKERSFGLKAMRCDRQRIPIIIRCQFIQVRQALLVFDFCLAGRQKRENKMSFKRSTTEGRVS
jgi:hypothetical protein